MRFFIMEMCRMSMEFKEKKSEPHFNCDVNLLLRNFIQVHEDDEEILRLWIDAKRKIN